MKIKKIELNNFKRFTHLSVEDIPETTKLVALAEDLVVGTAISRVNTLSSAI